MLYADMDTDVCHNHNRQNTLYNYRVPKIIIRLDRKANSQSNMCVKIWFFEDKIIRCCSIYKLPLYLSGNITSAKFLPERVELEEFKKDTISKSFVN